MQEEARGSSSALLPVKQHGYKSPGAFPFALRIPAVGRLTKALKKAQDRPSGKV